MSSDQMEPLLRRNLEMTREGTTRRQHRPPQRPPGNKKRRYDAGWNISTKVKGGCEASCEGKKLACWSPTSSHALSFFGGV